MLFEYRSIEGEYLDCMFAARVLRSWAKVKRVVKYGKEATGIEQIHAGIINCCELLEVSRRWNRDPVKGQSAIVMMRDDEQITFEWRSVERREIFGRREVGLEGAAGVVYPPNIAFAGEHVEPGAKGDEDACGLGIVPPRGTHVGSVAGVSVGVVIGAIDEVEPAGVIGEVLHGAAAQGGAIGFDGVGTREGPGGIEITRLQCGGPGSFTDEDIALVLSIEEHPLDVDEAGMFLEARPIGGAAPFVPPLLEVSWDTSTSEEYTSSGMVLLLSCWGLCPADVKRGKEPGRFFPCSRHCALNSIELITRST